MSEVSYIERPKLKVTYNKWTAREIFEETEGALKLSTIAVAFLSLIYPPLAGGFVTLALDRFYRFYREFFGDKEKHAIYQRKFKPKMASKHFLRVGYEVPLPDLDKHVNMLDGLDDEDEKAIELAKKKEKEIKTYKKWYEVGLSKKQLVTHWWIIGTTGAGKTSFIMTAIKEQMKNGGGVMFVDGKADEKMASKMYNLAKAEGREHDFYLINFLNVDSFKTHTNTFNPIAGAPANQVLEFLVAMLGEPSGDQAYWQGRGKALMQPIVYFLAFREKYYGEPYTFTVINDYVSDFNKFLFMVGVLRAFVTAYNNSLSENSAIEPLFKKAKAYKGVTDPDFPYLDALVYYYKNNPGQKTELIIQGIDFDYMDMLWQVYIDAMSYTNQVSPEVGKHAIKIGEALYSKFGDEILEVGMEELLSAYSKLTAEDSSYILNTMDFQDAIQQHSYAQQQWTDLMSTLNLYSHIFSSLTPDVDVLDILKNQKLLYVLLPPLKQSAKTTNILGRLIITSFRFAVSTALGGAFENLTATQKKIVAELITPRPLGLVILDEYGAYPVSGIDTLLAQVRSINVSVILSTQDYTSARVEGKDENSVKRVWANTQKLVLRIKDNETIDMLEKYMQEQYVAQPSAVMVDDYVHFKADHSFQKDKIFDPKTLLKFKNGCGMMIADAEPVVIQTYWSDAPPAKFITLNKYTKFA